MTLLPTISALIARLESVVGDRIRVSGDPEFDARLTLYGGAPRVPALIVQPRDAHEVARLLPAIADSGLPVTVRAGGHSLARRSRVADGVVIDLSLLDRVDIDASARTASAGGGVTAGRYTEIAAQHGLATGFGDTGSVGIAGLTLGGGIGFLSRRAGLAADQLTGAELVTADGRILQVDADTEPDLFWALRGGGPGLGVVTTLRYRLSVVRTVVGGVLLFEADAGALARIVAHLASADDDLSTMVNVMLAPPAPFVPERLRGRPVIGVFAAHAGTAERAAADYEELRALGSVVADTIRDLPYPAMLADHEEQRGMIPVARSGFADSFDTDRAAQAIDALASFDAPASVVNLRPMGGAIARVAPDATAFAHRDRAVMVIVTAGYREQTAADSHQETVDDVTRRLTDGETGYLNFFSEVPDVDRRAFPPATLERLRIIRSAHDPEGMFRR